MRSSWLLVVIVVVCLAGLAQGGNWPAWRGPEGTGVSEESGLPTKWSASENVVWKVPLPDEGNSTPIVWGEKIFVTGPLEKGARRTLMCFDRAAGKLLWQSEVSFSGQEQTHGTNPYCSASPVTDGEQVIAWHGSAGMVAYDLEGQELWRRDLGAFDHIWGNAASPVLFGDLVIANCGPGPQTVILALDKRTGEEVWRREPADARGKPDEFKGSWSTPVLRGEAKEGPELLLSLPHELVAWDPRTGQDLWSCRGLGDLVYTSPLVGEGAVVAMSGYGGPALAARTGGTADVTETHRLWVVAPNTQRVGSGVIVGQHVYIMEEDGVVKCIEVQTGNALWAERPGEGKTWSSMAYADGRLYAINMDGATYVLEASPAGCKVIAENPLGELTRGSLAFSDGQIFIRTYKHLWCVGNNDEIPNDE